MGTSRAVVERGLRHDRARSVRQALRAAGRRDRLGVGRLAALRPSGGEPFFYCLIRDITAQQRAHTRLSRQAAEQSAVARLGRFALGEQDLDALTHEVASVVAATLEIDHCVVMELESDGSALRAVAGVGLHEGVLRGMRIPSPPGSLLALALSQSEPLVVEDVNADPRLRGEPLLNEFIVGSGMSVLVRTRTDAWGLLAVYSDTSRAFEPDEVEFLAAVANVVSGAVERHRVEEDIRHRALHDPLTGLPNRVLALDRLAERWPAAGATRDVAVVLLDLDRFKLVNDSLGHEAGDALLTALAPRLEAPCARPTPWPGWAATSSWSSARTSTAPAPPPRRGAAGRRRAPAAGPRRRGALRERVDRHRAGRERGRDPDPLIRDADAAMYRAKERGRGRYELFDESLRRRVLVRLRIESELRRALERDELRVHYQPIVDVRERRSSRWRRWCAGCTRNAGCWAASSSIGRGDGTDRAARRVVLSTACRDVAGWQRRFDGEPPVMLCVNASATPDRRHGVPRPRRRVRPRRSGLAAGSLAIEITESVLIDEAHAPRDRAQPHARLRARADASTTSGPAIRGSASSALPTRCAQDRSLVHRRPRGGCRRRRDHAGSSAWRGRSG